MHRSTFHGVVLSLTLAVVLSAASGGAQEAPSPTAPVAKHAKAPRQGMKAEPVLEPKAIELLKAASARLAAARSMAFTAVVSYENPSRLGPPLLYSVRSEVMLKRPDKLRVLALGDGPPTEFYYDGKTMMAFSPAENVVAVAEAPPTIDAALEAAYDSAAIYFPFSDMIVTDPYGDIAASLQHAFYIGQSQQVGGTTTDMVGYVAGDVFVQLWIGAADQLPRRARAVYLNDPVQLRHDMELSGWQLDRPLPADSFGSSLAAAATRIDFARPDPPLPPGSKPRAKGKPAATDKQSETP